MKRHNKRKGSGKPKTCDDRCDCFCYIGDGDAVCNKTMPPKTIMEDWAPTDDFFWCGGSKR